MQIDILDIQGKVTGRKVELPDEIFAAEPNEHVVYLAVKKYLAAQRQGTHKVKNRKEVKGSSRKLHKQKGTGGSRKGNIRNPLYKGGGSIFGPQPHTYTLKLNKKEKDLARVSVFSAKAKAQAIRVVEAINLTEPSTKTFASILKNLQLADKKVLFLMEGTEARALKLSLRNIPSVLGVAFSRASIYDMLHADVLLFCEGAARFFEQMPVEADSPSDK